MESVMNLQKNRKTIWFILIKKNHKNGVVHDGQPQNFIRLILDVPLLCTMGRYQHLSFPYRH